MKFLVFFVISSFARSQIIHKSAGTSVEVLGQSGKARITRGNNVVTMQVDYLSEVDASGNQVGQVSNPKHTIQSFATQDFTFTPLVQKQFQNITSHEFTFETPVNTIGNMRIVTILVNDEGKIGTETETWDVSPGDVKWNIELTDWTFCSPCSDGTAQYIDVGIEIKGTKSEFKRNQTIDLGDATLELSNRVVVDGQETFMAKGYPKIVTKGVRDLYIFRFPKFATKATYDPLLQLSSVANNDQRHKPALIVVMLCTLAAVVFV